MASTCRWHLRLSSDIGCTDDELLLVTINAHGKVAANGRMVCQLSQTASVHSVRRCTQCCLQIEFATPAIAISLHNCTQVPSKMEADSSLFNSDATILLSSCSVPAATTRSAMNVGQPNLSGTLVWPIVLMLLITSGH